MKLLVLHNGSLIYNTLRLGDNKLDMINRSCSADTSEGNVAVAMVEPGSHLVAVAIGGMRCSKNVR